MSHGCSSNLWGMKMRSGTISLGRRVTDRQGHWHALLLHREVSRLRATTRKTARLAQVGRVTQRRKGSNVELWATQSWKAGGSLFQWSAPSNQPISSFSYHFCSLMGHCSMSHASIPRLWGKFLLSNSSSQMMGHFSEKCAPLIFWTPTFYLDQCNKWTSWHSMGRVSDLSSLVSVGGGHWDRQKR